MPVKGWVEFSCLLKKITGLEGESATFGSDCWAVNTDDSIHQPWDCHSFWASVPSSSDGGDTCFMVLLSKLNDVMYVECLAQGWHVASAQ